MSRNGSSLWMVGMILLAFGNPGQRVSAQTEKLEKYFFSQEITYYYAPNSLRETFFISDEIDAPNLQLARQIAKEIVDARVDQFMRGKLEVGHVVRSELVVVPVPIAKPPDQELPAAQPIRNFEVEVRGWYKELGRDPDAPGLKYWTEEHRNWVQRWGDHSGWPISFPSPPPDARKRFFNEPEAVRPKVKQLYLEILKRDPEPSGLEFWVEFYRRNGAGKTREWMTNEAEFLSPAIQQFYRDFNGREADGPGLEFWITFAQKHGLDATRSAMANAPEALEHWVTLRHLELCGRKPDPLGLKFWTQFLKDRGREVTFRRMSNEPEALEYVVKKEYESSNQTPDPAGVAFWTKFAQDNGVPKMQEWFRAELRKKK